MNKDINFGVIGVGFMGALLARVGYELPLVQLKSVADIDEVTGQKVAEQYAANYYSDYRIMLEAEDLDAVAIATPESRHKEPAVKAAQHGLDLFVEKPLATDLDDADAIIEACKTERVKLMVGYILRFEACYAKIKEAIEEGSIGRFLSAYARRNTSIQEVRRVRGRTSAVKFLGVHDIDQILWYHPSNVTRVSAKAIEGRVMKEYGTPDFIWTTLEFEDGRLGVVESGWGLPERWTSWKNPSQWASFGDARMDVTGAEGVISLDLTPMNLWGVDSGEGRKFPDTRHWPVVNDQVAGAIRLELEHFFNCIRQDRSPLVTGEEARRSLEVAIAAERSLETGQEVELPL